MSGLEEHMFDMMFRGVVHGKSIELDRETGLAEGHVVVVLVKLPAGTSPTSLEAWQALRRSGGVVGEEAKDLDEYLEYIRKQRRGGLPEEPE